MLWSRRKVPTLIVQHVPNDKRVLLRGHEHRRSGDVFGTAEAVEQDVFEPPLAGVLVQSGEHRGLDLRWGDGVDHKAVRRQFDRESLDQADHAGPGRGIAGEGLDLSRPVHRGDVDDSPVPLSGHRPGSGPSADEDTLSFTSITRRRCTSRCSDTGTLRAIPAQVTNDIRPAEFGDGPAGALGLRSSHDSAECCSPGWGMLSGMEISYAGNDRTT